MPYNKDIMSTFVPFPEERGVEPMKEVLSRLMIARGWGNVSAQARLEGAWKAAAGPDWEGLSQVLALRRGVLEVSVRDAMTHQHLVMMKAQLLKSVQARLGPQVKDIKMRVG